MKTSHNNFKLPFFPWGGKARTCHAAQGSLGEPSPRGWQPSTRTKPLTLRCYGSPLPHSAACTLSTPPAWASPLLSSLHAMTAFECSLCPSPQWECTLGGSALTEQKAEDLRSVTLAVNTGPVLSYTALSLSLNLSDSGVTCL